MADRVVGVLRSAGSELRTVRGEVIAAVGLAAFVAVLYDDSAALILGPLAIVGVVLAALVVSSRLRRPHSTSAGVMPAKVDTPEANPRVPIARARLQEVGSELGLRRPAGPPGALDRDRYHPKVTVVVPCFNDVRYVAETLQSVIGQSYDNWECVVVDDASGDGSWDLIRRVVGDDERFTTIRLEANQGSGAARNRGIEAAAGDLVAFLDADDLLLRESLADRVRALDAHRDDVFVAGSFCAVRSEPEEVALSELPDRRHATQAPFIDFVVARGECPFTLHAPLVRLGRIRSVGGFDETMRSGAVDWDLWYRLLRNGYVFVPSRTLGAVYRQKPGGITRSNKASHTRAGARLVRAAFDRADPSVMVDPSPFPMSEPLGVYEGTLVVAERAIRFAAMALADGDRDDMRESLRVLDAGTWPLLDRHIDWPAVVGRGVARVVGLRPKDVGELGDALAPFVQMVRETAEEMSS